MFLDHVFFYPPDGRRPDGQGKNIMTLQLRWAGHKNKMQIFIYVLYSLCNVYHHVFGRKLNKYLSETDWVPRRTTIAQSWYTVECKQTVITTALLLHYRKDDVTLSFQFLQFLSFQEEKTKNNRYTAPVFHLSMCKRWIESNEGLLRYGPYKLMNTVSLLNFREKKNKINPILHSSNICSFHVQDVN